MRLMEKSFLIIAMAVTLQAGAVAEFTEQTTAVSATPSQVYLDTAITLQHKQLISEGMLAYAQHYAAGKILHVVSSERGITLYSLQGGQAQIISELTKTQLGFNQYSSINKIVMSPDDKWIMLVGSNDIVSIPINSQYQPVLSEMTALQYTSYGQLAHAGNLLTVFKGATVDTFSIDAENGKLVALNTLSLPTHGSRHALAQNTLVVAHDRWDMESPNLVVYKLTGNQWLAVAEHRLGQRDYAHVDYLTVNPLGTRIVYGDYNSSSILDFLYDSNALISVYSGDNLFNGWMNSVNFLDEKEVIVAEYSSLRKYNTDTQQYIVSYDLDGAGIIEQDISVTAEGVSFLNAAGIVSLNSADLSLKGSVKPGELDIVYQFNNSYSAQKLGENYLLSVTDNAMVRLFKFDEEGVPKLKQSGTAEQLIGLHSSYINAITLNTADQLYMLTYYQQYAVVKIDTENDALQLLFKGVLTGHNNNVVYAEPNRTAVIGNNLFVANGDTINMFALDQNNRFQFINALKDGISGTTGINSIDLLIANHQHLYSINNQSQTIVHFSLNNNELVQTGVYDNFQFAGAYSYLVRNNLLTLGSSNLMQVFSLAEQGEVTEHSVQVIGQNNDAWLNIGERFIATTTWDGISIMEQDSASGVWYSSLTLDSQTLQQDYNISSYRLIPTTGSLMIYDAQKRQLHTFSHNSAPYVIDSSKLALSLNQGQAAQFQLADMIRDDEEPLLTYTLQGADAAFALDADGKLMFDGQLITAGDFDVLAEDAASLGSQIRFTYNVNKAPVLKAASPTLSKQVGDSFHFDLASYYTDPEDQAIRYALTTAPAGVSLSETGILAGTFNTAGTVTLNFTTTDTAGATSTHSMTATVTAKPEEASGSGGSTSFWMALTLVAIALHRQRLVRR